MAGLCEGGNEPPGSLKAITRLSSLSKSVSTEMAVDIRNKERCGVEGIQHDLHGASSSSWQTLAANGDYIEEDVDLFNITRHLLRHPDFIFLLAALALLALAHITAAQGQSSVQLSNGQGYKFDYGIQHAHHGHHHGSSYPHAYGGYGGPGYHIGSGYYTHV
ncbi:hypothetical protein ANN_21652 [Periplaneta americana]|uniref:Uncharacterized protein n=1 Tax=Periplaneta americana TaxID=6978 RepID=A0ABQ8S6C1_PERAM|nr:hypothetical protein ANN_21652 [Periplaneta americana]